MINFKNITDTAGPEKLQHIITIQGHPVWDYKLGQLNTVYLISEDPWEGSEEEYVTLGELRKYIVSCEVPFDLVQLRTEADRELITSYKWEDNQLNFFH